MRLDERLALALALGPVAVALVVAGAGAEGVFVGVLLLALAARGLAAGSETLEARGRLDLVALVGVAAFILLLAERARRALNA